MHNKYVQLFRFTYWISEAIIVEIECCLQKIINFFLFIYKLAVKKCALTEFKAYCLREFTRKFSKLHLLGFKN